MDPSWKPQPKQPNSYEQLLLMKWGCSLEALRGDKAYENIQIWQREEELMDHAINKGIQKL